MLKCDIGKANEINIMPGAKFIIIIVTQARPKPWGAAHYFVYFSFHQTEVVVGSSCALGISYIQEQYTFL